MSFGSQLKAYARKQNKRVEKVAAAAILEASASVIKKTPVDEGRARGSWQSGVNAPASSPTARTGAGGAILEAATTVPASIGGVFYLTSNLPYIRKLEYGLYTGNGPKTTSAGYSTQAPAGMVRITVKEFNKALKRALRNN